MEKVEIIRKSERKITEQLEIISLDCCSLILILTVISTRIILIGWFPVVSNLQLKNSVKEDKLTNNIKWFINIYVKSFPIWSGPEEILTLGILSSGKMEAIVKNKIYRKKNIVSVRALPCNLTIA